MSARRIAFAGLSAAMLLSVALPARADVVLRAPYARSGQTGECGGDPGTTCSYAETADATTGRLSVALRAASGTAPAHAYADGEAGIEADSSLLVAAQSVTTTVDVHVGHASIAHDGALLGPLAAHDQNRSQVLFYIQTIVNGCACSTIVQPVLLDDAGTTSMDGRDLSYTVVVTNTDGGFVQPGGITVEVSAYGIARLRHDVSGVTLPEAGSVSVAADITVTDVRIA